MQSTVIKLCYRAIGEVDVPDAHVGPIHANIFLCIACVHV